MSIGNHRFWTGLTFASAKCAVSGSGASDGPAGLEPDEVLEQDHHREREARDVAEGGGGDGIHAGADLAEADRALHELRDRYASRVREARKRLKLSQEEAGRIIGGGKRAFQKYESGATPPSDAAAGLIELLMRHREEVETLRAMRAAGA